MKCAAWQLSWLLACVVPEGRFACRPLAAHKCPFGLLGGVNVTWGLTGGLRHIAVHLPLGGQVPQVASWVAKWATPSWQARATTS